MLPDGFYLLGGRSRLWLKQAGGEAAASPLESSDRASHMMLTM
jgi:hypothetical protein